MARRTNDGRPPIEPPDQIALALGDGYDEAYDDVWRAAWKRKRDEMLDEAELAKRPGDRPWAWWAFEAPDDTPDELLPGAGDPNDADALYAKHLLVLRFLAERGLLAATERDALLEKVRELAAMGYADFDPYENMAQAREGAEAAGITGEEIEAALREGADRQGGEPAPPEEGE